MFSRLFTTNTLPKINLFITSSALFFQTTVLLPWHNDISKQIYKLESEITSLKNIIICDNKNNKI